MYKIKLLYMSQIDFGIMFLKIPDFNKFIEVVKAQNHFKPRRVNYFE